MLVVPAFDFLKSQPDPPRTARVVIRNEVLNEHGTSVIFTVEESRKGDCWWIYASYADNGRSGFRASNTMRTRVGTKGREWIAAVESGRVCVGRDAQPRKRR